MKKIILFIFSYFILLPSYEALAQFPLQVGNRWDFTDCWWNPTGGWGCDTIRYFVISDTLLTNSKRYYLIRPKNYYFFWDYMRADSTGIYYYDTLCNKEWLYFDYNLPVGGYTRTGFPWSCDTINSAKIIKQLDTTTIFWGDTLRMLKYFCSTGIDNDYWVTIIPKFGFVSWDQYGFFANYNMNLKGCILSGIVHGTLTSIKDNKIFPSEFSLSQNYPNPFNPSTKIQYTIGSRQFITLKVFDALGNEVDLLVNEEKEAGTYEAEFSIRDGHESGIQYPVSSIQNLSSGIYFYQLRVGNLVQTKKMLFLK